MSVCLCLIVSFFSSVCQSFGPFVVRLCVCATCQTGSKVGAYYIRQEIWTGLKPEILVIFFMFDLFSFFFFTYACKSIYDVTFQAEIFLFNIFFIWFFYSFKTSQK